MEDGIQNRYSLAKLACKHTHTETHTQPVKKGTRGTHLKYTQKHAQIQTYLLTHTHTHIHIHISKDKLKPIHCTQQK